MLVPFPRGLANGSNTSQELVIYPASIDLVGHADFGAEDDAQAIGKRFVRRPGDLGVL
jgi:hypothetical protein